MFITMTKLTKLGGSAASLALATSMIVGSAGEAFAATVPTYAGGATFPEVVYRTIFDCYADNGSGGSVAGDLGPLPAECAAAGLPTRTDLQMLYAGVGSGNGLKAFSQHDASQLVSGSRTPGGPDCIVQPYSDDGAGFGPFFNKSGANPQPTNNETACADGTFRGITPAYTAYHFTGSDDPLPLSNLNEYHGLGGLHNGTDFNNLYGKPIQVPTLIGGVTVAFNPPSPTFNPVGKKASGGTSKLDLSRESYCGIFTGKITDWNDSHLTADNKGVSLTGGVSKPIEVVVRGDGSGTTFVFSNALIHQCGSDSHPGAGLPGLGAGMTFPDQWMTDNSIAGDPTDPATRSNNNFFINVNTAGHLPTNFTLKNGNGGIQLYSDNKPGVMAYLSGDFVKPAAGNTDGNGNPTMASANLQQWYDVTTNGKVSAGSGTLWAAVGAASVAKVVAGVLPPSFAANCGTLPEGCAIDPLAWGKAVPMPPAKGAFPIGGFTFADFYSCYASATTFDALFGQTAGSLGFWRWYYGTATENQKLPKTLLAKNSFSVIPGKWNGAIKKLMFKNAGTKIGVVGSGNCTGGSFVGPGA
jgi:ABC-type phosphate transport system substrate-binding protein